MKKTLSIIAILAAAVSCQLHREDYTEIYEDQFFKTENDLFLAVNALYYDFNTGDWNGVYEADGKGYQTFSDMTTDLAWCNWGWGWDNYHFHQWRFNVGINDEVWTHFSRYRFLSQARQTIRRIEKADVADDLKPLYIAEAKALRGWMALYLYDFFGPVPVASDEVLDNPTEFAYLERLSEEEWDKMMESDLLYAIENLPAQTDRGRMSKGSSRMILMKYYMIRGGEKERAGKHAEALGFFKKAEDLARDLLAMEGSVYSLQPDYNYVFSKTGIGNDEIVLCLPANNGISGWVNYMVAECLPEDMPWAEKGTGWGGYFMPWEFYDSFENGDTRLENVFDHYTTKLGVVKSRLDLNGAVVMKYGLDPEMLDSRCFIDVVVYRFSDVLLTLAECINRREGAPTQEAIDLVNRVRTRAGIQELSLATENYDSFNERILTERGHEFFFEGLRRQDLIRFGKYVEYANQRIDDANATRAAGYFNVDDSHNRFYIPESFIQESKNKIKQNPGY